MKFNENKKLFTPEVISAIRKKIELMTKHVLALFAGVFVLFLFTGKIKSFDDIMTFALTVIVALTFYALFTFIIYTALASRKDRHKHLH